ncbi:MAG: 3'(2'),5'-bisphosphate nucleotidase CysQ [Thiomicrospira sp.]|uniref:3'(2'),5'-bisphosphate nucleotidase CysQ n=1 Tax=Thiomicrospira sp. TaxID=935 RepID=UPI0019F615CF|nr:3'(2'),5'-bisphosphate nucleotidase CysQ [Thiomicrospira sp.]MBE0494166.1 3'(2'),5'-bisphosphate nucleotidase CysQ [Thiomicrospira sp.]
MTPSAAIPSKNDYQAWLPEVCKAAHHAGKLILEIYRCPECKIEKKADGSPVTLADKMADESIRLALTKLTPNIPVVSEENIDSTLFSERQNWSVYWLVDPLDGTKEFIERTDEFCVNIALIVNQQPVLGVVYGPVLDVTYCAIKGQAASKVYQNKTQTIQVRLPVREPIKVAVSRRHGTKVKAFQAALPASETVHMGSALKSCLVAEGVADVYPRFGPTSHWDTAASQVIVESAGGRIVDAQGRDLRYQPSPSLLNPYFMVVGDPQFAWPAFPG